VTTFPVPDVAREIVTESLVKERWVGAAIGALRLASLACASRAPSAEPKLFGTSAFFGRLRA